MQIRLTQSYPKSSNNNNRFNSNTSSHIQHGLSDIPAETLTHICAFLDPYSLSTLATTCKRFSEIVKDDAVWRAAFLYQFLGIRPEREQVETTLTLKRTESTWRKEFIRRHEMIRRWERSRSATISHVPLHSTLASIHLLSDRHSLLSSSLLYGVVARSFPLTGKVLKGYLDASGTVNGLGNGNPNVEFAPDVSAIALYSEGATACVLWGFRGGAVALTTARKAMDAARGAARLEKCSIEDEHKTAILDLAFGTAPTMLFVTGSADGQVKLWHAKRLHCVWSSPEMEVFDPIMKVILSQNSIVAAHHSGKIVLWSGFSVNSIDEKTEAPEDIHENVVIPKEGSPDIILVNGSSVLVHYTQDDHFFTFDVRSSHITQFTEGHLGSITSIVSSTSSHGTYILSGDNLGEICVWPWVSDIGDSVSRNRNWSAHDAAITSLTVSPDGALIGSGDNIGQIKVWDAVTFVLLRSFHLPGRAEDAVRQIILDREMVIAAVGARVIAWRIVPGSEKDKHGKGKMRIRGNGKRAAPAKWLQQLEMKRDIRESRAVLAEENATIRLSNQRNREQLDSLNKLGLEEHEMLEYVLMLSRDEAQANAGNTSLVSEEQEGLVGDMDFDYPASPASPSSSVVPAANLTPVPSPPRQTRSQKVQLAHRTLPIGSSSSMNVSPPSTESFDDSFPSFEASTPSSSVPSSAPSRSPLSTPTRTVANSWNTVSPLSTSLRSNPSISPSASLSARLNAISTPSKVSPAAPDLSTMDEDEQLRLAIERSLAEVNLGNG